MQSSIEERKKLGFLFGNLKKVIDPIVGAIESAVGRVHKVEVTNKDTEVLLEVAKNTRGLKQRLDNLKELTIDTKPLEAAIDSLGKSFPKNDMQNGIRISNLHEMKPKDFPLEFRVSNLSEIKVPETQKVDILPLEKAVKDLKTALSSIYDYLPNLKQQKIEIPTVKIPSKVSIKESEDIISALQGLRDDIGQLYEMLDEKEFGSGGSQSVISTSAAVSSVNVNALRGITKSTAITVTTSPTILPTYPLVNRKSIIVFNNSASTTLYIGGADVTTSNGLPVPYQSYSPPIDAHDTHDVYAIVSTGSIDVRVLEVSSEREGS